MKASESGRAQTMARREFLGVGATMGASTMLNGAPISTVPQVSCMVIIPSSAECVREMNNVEWAIPARHLNTLWSMLWPRIAARIWQGEPPNFGFAVADNGWPTALVNTDIRPWIRGWIDWFRTQGLGSSCFQEAIADLQAYLSAPGGGTAPIYYLADGGYDFLISPRGIELWAPPPLGPNPLQQLLDNYEHRRTGRPAIGIGGVMSDGELTPVLAESPTGPGQISTIEPGALTATLNAVGIDGGSSAPGQFCAALQGARAAVRRLARIGAGTGGRGGGPPGAATPEQVAESLTSILRSLTPPPGHPRLEAVQNVISDANLLPPDGFDVAQGVIDTIALFEAPCANIPVTLYECAVMPTRCWVLTGSVYRGLLEQFPRFVAEAWGDDSGRDVRALNVRNGLEQRMEMAFPEAMRFEFLDRGALPPGLALGIGAAALWDSSQIMLTNAGVFFPWTIGATTSAGSTGTPTEGALLQAIVAGRAGNPIFTDSARTL